MDRMLASRPRAASCRTVAPRRGCITPSARHERGFKVLKSGIEIAPVYHRLAERIRAYAWLCFMALIVYRVMRQRLETCQERTQTGKGVGAVAPSPKEQPQHQCRRAYHRHLHHQHPAGQRAGGTEAQYAHPRRSNVPAVVAAERLASMQINHLQRLVSNLGKLCCARCAARDHR